MNEFAKYIATAALGALLAGCMVGPDYHRPATTMPASFATTRPVTQPAGDISQWWTTFGDPMLSSLIQQAAKSNLDVAQAETRVRQARATRDVVAGGLFPTLDASSSYRRAYTAGAGGRNLYQAGLDANWELDIFGGTRRKVEAADADIVAALDDQNSVLVTLAGEVALNYIDLRAVQLQIQIAQDNLVSQNRSADIARRRFAAGMTSRLDLVNAEAQLATTRSQIPALETQARQDMYAIAVLLGRPPGALVEQLTAASPIPPSPPQVPVGLPSDLLLRRPDLQRAEARIHAATARVGVATAALYPTFSLTGAFGTASSQLRGLTNLDNQSWSIGPSISYNLFNGGSTQAQIEFQKAVGEEVLLAYKSSILTALQEVENSLVSYEKEQQRREALMIAVADNREALDLAQRLYAQGQVEFIEVLTAQRSLYVTEDALAQSTRTVSTSLVSLYKALGGGWAQAGGATRPASRPAQQ